MDFNEYQKEALTTAIYPCDKLPNYLTIAICGESGELAEKVKKIYRDKGGIYSYDDTKGMALELGDILYYIAIYANVLGYDLSDIAKMNLEKIAGRMERGTIHGNGDYR